MCNTLKELIESHKNGDLTLTEYIEKVEEYVKLNGDVKAIFDLAELDYLDGLEAQSVNPIYRIGYATAYLKRFKPD